MLASAIRDAWSRCLADGERGTVEAADDPVPAPPVDVRLDGGDDLAYRLMVTTQEITHSLITAQIGRLLMFHAGAVCHPLTGDSLVYVAAGGTGKTTLSRRMGTRFGYLTDETVGIDGTGRILAYPKPLSIRPSASAPVKDEVSPDRIGLLRAPASAHVTRVVMLDRRPSTDVLDAQLEEVHFMDAVFRAHRAGLLPAGPGPPDAAAGGAHRRRGTGHPSSVLRVVGRRAGPRVHDRWCRIEGSTESGDRRPRARR